LNRAIPSRTARSRREVRLPPAQPHARPVEEGVQEDRRGGPPEEAEVGVLDEEDEGSLAVGLLADEERSREAIAIISLFIMGYLARMR
jgi:hypothetical protein